MKIAIIDCGVGNIGSIHNAIKMNIPTSKYILDIVKNPNNLLKYDFLILPGVGSFDGFMSRLEILGFDKAIKSYVNQSQGTLLGICVGMQILFDFGYENIKCKGLGLIPGTVKLLETKLEKIRIPHVGWNKVTFKDNFSEFNGNYYFTHSYVVYTNPEYISGTFNHGVSFTASVKRGLIYGFQFHPEKSGDLGSRLLINFVQS